MRKPVSAFTKCFSQRETLRVSFHCINGRMTKRQGKNSSEGPDVTHCLAWVRLGKSNGLWGLLGTLVPFWSRIQRGHGPGFLLIGIMWESLTRCWRSVCRRKVTRGDSKRHCGGRNIGFVLILSHFWARNNLEHNFLIYKTGTIKIMKELFWRLQIIYVKCWHIIDI